ncbi:MAG: ArsA family ATPase [Gemmatimonadota bacterium]|nr:ArsA family ATPase [Gemmatimonadota bacterium]
MRELDSLLDALPAWVLVGGKGGVGKTTCAGALAARAASRGESTLLLSLDPARSLGDALGCALRANPEPVPGRPGLDAAQLDTGVARDDFLSRWRGVLLDIVDRGTYLDRSEIESLIDAALPGADETMAILTLSQLEGDERWHRIVIDTAPTGHTLRLLHLPDSFRALLSLLDAMQEKHRFMVRALTRRYRSDEADAFLAQMRQQTESIHTTFTNARRLAVCLVSRPEAVVVAETRRYAEALDGLGMRVGALVVNAVPSALGPQQVAALAELRAMAPVARHYSVPLSPHPPLGIASLDAWGESLTKDTVRSDSVPRPRAGSPGTSPRAAAQPLPLPTRPLLIVGGKGGVGKTSAACAIGIAVARAERPALVVSTDPAPSVGDALDQAIGEEVMPVRGASGLFAQQLDAAAAFGRFRDDYGTRVTGVFDALMGASVDASHDRRVLSGLLSLAPPGIDELYALSALGETVGAGRYSTVIVDPAPTGHLLRLLDMPRLALEWSHLLLRLMLRYKEIVALGDAAEQLLAFARRTRELAALLHDPSRAGLLIVALDEPLVRSETLRLVAAARAIEIPVLGVLWNRVGARVEPLPSVSSDDQFQASVAEPPPRGVPALQDWLRTWTPLHRAANG